MQFAIECTTRTEGSKPNALRREGLLPANLYGHNNNESMALTLDYKEAVTLLKNASINNTLVDVSVSDQNWSGKALIREVQSHPWKRSLYHISFFCVDNQKTLEVIVPIKFSGTAVGIKRGGLMEQFTNEVKVLCPPDAIPDFIDIDITNVNIGQNYRISDLVLTEGVTVLDDPAKTLFTIVAPAKMRG